MIHTEWCFRWSDPDFYDLTDTLLTKIEENLRYRKVLGFETGDITVNSGDLTLIKVCRQLVPLVFPLKEPDEKLALSIKSRVTKYVHVVLSSISACWI